MQASGNANFGGVITDDLTSDIVIWETSLNTSVRAVAVQVNTSEQKISVGTTVPVARVEAGRILWAINVIHSFGLSKSLQLPDNTIVGK